MISNYIEKTLVFKWLELYDENYLSLINSLKLIPENGEVEEITTIIEHVLLALFKYVCMII